MCDSTGHIQGANRRELPGTDGKDCWRIAMNRPEIKQTVQHPNPNWAWADPNAGTSKPAPKGQADGHDGGRNGGGTLTYKGIKLTEPPKTIIRIIDN